MPNLQDWTEFFTNWRDDLVEMYGESVLKEMMDYVKECDPSVVWEVDENLDGPEVIENEDAFNGYVENLLKFADIFNKFYNTCEAKAKEKGVSLDDIVVKMKESSLRPLLEDFFEDKDRKDKSDVSSDVSHASSIRDLDYQFVSDDRKERQKFRKISRTYA